MQIIPVEDKILIEEVTETEGTLKVTDRVIRKGKVLAIGEGITLADGTVKPIPLSVGDVILYEDKFTLSINEINSNAKIITYRNIIGKELSE